MSDLHKWVTLLSRNQKLAQDTPYITIEWHWEGEAPAELIPRTCENTPNFTVEWNR